MKKVVLLFFLILTIAVLIISFRQKNNAEAYISTYGLKLNLFRQSQLNLLEEIRKADIGSETGLSSIREKIGEARTQLKAVDFWFRYLEPTDYKKINGPLPVEWETEVFEKFEKPYKRDGAGLTLTELYIEEENAVKDSLIRLVQSSLNATEVYAADSITRHLQTQDHFFLCNRLFLLNLASIYTTGFECPDTSRIIPELRLMLADVESIYHSFNLAFPTAALQADYLQLFRNTVEFAEKQPANYSSFDHYLFIKDYVNPLFKLNQRYINQYRVVSRSFVDYSLDKRASSIFSKELYRGQNTKGIYMRVTEENELKEIENAGRLLFYDPIVSGNNSRSCASCHKTGEYFTDTVAVTAFQFNHKDPLPRNTPSLVNVEFNHLVMLDGKHISLQNQTKEVMTNPVELGSTEKEILQKILSCPDYKKIFGRLVKYTPLEPELTFEHISSAITFYYSKFSKYYAPFDNAINNGAVLDANARNGFNLFMSKAQCATCHFVPQFNGVKPPFVGSEFEVLGVPADTSFRNVSPDKGRYNVNPAYETMNAFRTGSLRNIEHTAPYMHNGVFRTLGEVIDFYDAGGGAGRGLPVINQTLSSDSLQLSKKEKDNLVQFLRSLNEDIPAETPPVTLPLSKSKALNKRKVGGEY